MDFFMIDGSKREFESYEEYHNAFKELATQGEPIEGDLLAEYAKLFPDEHDAVPFNGYPHICLCLPIVEMENTLLLAEWGIRNKKSWRECPLALAAWDVKAGQKFWDEHPDVLF